MHQFICLGNSDFIWDLARTGDYQIFNCGDLASEVIHELQTLWQILQPSLADIDRGGKSSDAFNTFFKQVQNAPIVADVLKNISTGAGVVAAHLHAGFPTVPVAPVIACAVNESMDPNQIAGAYPSQNRFVNMLAAAYNFCKENKNEYAFILQGTMMVVLCQEHFQQPFMTPPDKCMAQSKGPSEPYMENGQTFGYTRV